jgi:hypothetical protein
VIEVNFNASEQTVKDLYQLAIFDHGFNKPPDCIKADPELDYCQLLG